MCKCGCMTTADAPGFDRFMDTRGVWIGRGAGYQLVKRTLGWDVLSPSGDSIFADRAPALVETFDLTNAAAVKHAREAGHGHP